MVASKTVAYYYVFTYICALGREGGREGLALSAADNATKLSALHGTGFGFRRGVGGWITFRENPVGIGSYVDSIQVIEHAS